jgi:hypothetical protein
MLRKLMVLTLSLHYFLELNLHTALAHPTQWTLKFAEMCRISLSDVHEVTLVNNTQTAAVNFGQDRRILVLTRYRYSSDSRLSLGFENLGKLTTDHNQSRVWRNALGCVKYFPTHLHGKSIRRC